MSQKTWAHLQRFAEGGDGGSAAGGEGANTGVGSDNPGRARLLELGVPEGKISKKAEKAVNRRMDASGGAAKAQPAPVQEQTPQPEPNAQQQEETANAEKATNRMTWKEITEDPEYKQEIQRMIQGRLRRAGKAEESLAQLSGAMEVLARKYGLNMEQLDYAALGKAIEDDASLDEKFYREMAEKSGVTPDVAKSMDRQARELERQKRINEMSAREHAMAQHFANLEQQAQKLQELYPNFDLRQAMTDERFARAVSPGGGLSVEQAYNAFHFKELQAAQNEITAKRIREEMSKSIQSNRSRPQELGSNSAASSVTKIDWRNATREQLKEMNERVRREGRVPL